MVKILVVEDDKDLNRYAVISLRNNGYEAVSAYDGIEALEKTEENKFDLILTDIMMPRMDGFDLAESIRLTDKTTPIIFMTAKDDKSSKMLGYSVGIDDYVTKPFDMDVLIMKINAILRRAKIKNDKELEIGNLKMNTEERSATVNGEEISLTVREFDLLFKLLSYPKKTFTRSALMEEFWDYDSSATSRTVDVYMAKLREKTSECDGFEIVTVHGLGYKVVLK
ncbi:MAG: response regulator transcription factor [Clostridia bacterium]|nr:response regulator transcription factor [Clostridia bacterium]MBO5440265.1 response regulator transcription factor [Clostridia bacterium]